MPTIEQLLRLKTDRLEEIPDELLSRLERVQKKVFPQVMEILSLLDRNARGEILLTDNNLRLLSTVQGQLRDVLLNSEYVEIVNEFAEEFEVQKGVSDALFKATFADFISSGRASGLVTLSKRQAVDVFINGITDSAFADAIYEQLDLAVANNASYSDTVKAIQSIVLGDETQESKLLRYSRQVAHDQFALADRSYTSAVSDELEAEWFFYSGSIIRGSRDFCRDRHNQYFFYKEIESWAALDWDGKIEPTNEKTIYTTLGGWNCRHTLIPVSIASVPNDVISRVMDSGLFSPSDVERELLGM